MACRRVQPQPPLVLYREDPYYISAAVALSILIVVDRSIDRPAGQPSSWQALAPIGSSAGQGKAAVRTTMAQGSRSAAVPAAASFFALLAVAPLLLCCAPAAAELARLEHPAKDGGSLSLLVVGDWGRKGAFNQSRVAHQVRNRR